jgi:hypothetical protein
MKLVEILVGALMLYAALGFLFGLAFVLRGVQRVDAAAKETGLGFRLIILPGAAALWPVLLRRWLA